MTQYVLYQLFSLRTVPIRSRMKV